MAPQLALNLARAHEFVENGFQSAAVKKAIDIILSNRLAAFLRILVALDNEQIPWNPDDWNGFGVERAAILDLAENDANNVIGMLQYMSVTLKRSNPHHLRSIDVHATNHSSWW